MLKKLQNLLFEDEDDDIVNDADQNSAPVKEPAAQPAAPKPAPVKPVETAPVEPAPVKEPVKAEPERPSMTRIDVAQPAEPKPVQEKPVSLGITADPAPVAEKPVAKKPVEPAKKENKDDAAVYQFRPVISPIFGVDEKDMTSLKNTTNKINKAKQEKKDTNVTPVLSPMYGVNVDETAAPVIDEDETANDLLSKLDTKTEASDDDIPEFSLDDILKVRDQEYADEKRPVDEDSAPDFPDLTFGSEPEPAEEKKEEAPKAEADPMPGNMPDDTDTSDSSIDNTVVIKQQLFDDDEK